LVSFGWGKQQANLYLYAHQVSNRHAGIKISEYSLFLKKQEKNKSELQIWNILKVIIIT